MRTSLASLPSVFVAMTLVIASAGCGLSDYEKRMDAQRARIQEFDKANQALDDPIEIPTRSVVQKGKDGAKDALKDDPAWPAEVFLRLAKGYSTKPKDKDPYYDSRYDQYKYFPFYRYGGLDPSYSIFVVVSLIAEEKSKEEPAKEEYGKYKKSTFRFLVRRAIEDYYAKSNPKLTLDVPDKAKEKYVEIDAFSPDSKSTDKVRYISYEYSDADNKQVKQKSTFRAYFHEDGNRQLCIVEHRPYRVPNEKFDKEIESALSTLDLSPGASAKRAQYKSLMKLP